MLSKPAHVVIALGLAQTLAWGSTYYLPAILANAMAAELGLGTAWIFTAFSAGLLLSAALGPAAGRLIDLHGGRRVLPVSNLVFALGLAGLGTCTGMASLFASWLVIGVGMGTGLYEAAFSTLAGIYGRDARRSITGITLIAGFASTVCWPLSAYMDVTLGWRATCYVWAAAHLVIGLPINLMLPSGRSHESDAQQPDETRKGRLAVIVGLSFVFAATWFCSTAMAAHLPRVLQESGASLAAAVAAAALVGPAQVAARVLEFWLMRRAHPIVSARIATLAHPVGAAVLIGTGAPAGTFFMPLAIFGAVGYGLRQGLMMAPARFISATSPFVFDLLLVRYGTASLVFTASLGIASFVVLLLLPVNRSRT